MNRELKFRIWDKQNKTFLKDPTRYKSLAIACDGRGVYIGHCDDCDVEDRYIIQQFTGLKDKNRKEIYEGDIVKYSRCHCVSIEKSKGVFTSELIEDGDFVGEIIFIFPSFCWSYDHKRYDDIENMTGASHRYEVIGNIFENPELLK
jgi:uncharacterized phage protein (TIGR01671 family)